MYVQAITTQGDLTAMLIGDIDHHTAREMRKEIDALIEKNHPSLLRLDFSAVQFMDSSGIGLIMGRYRLMRLIGGTVLVCNVPPHLKRLMDLSGIGSLGVLEYKGKEAIK
ncbi:MAG: anti-sigma factor antagonist [Acutalibacteraceae bacterium]|nr:anti-sigma factor antagonist [Acutalibacteraceae bacterium]MEE0265637.1 anti-sigma factor antagonist [Acutalibacteraceae bacterium]